MRETLLECVGGAADADAKMFRRFEEVAGHARGFEFVAQQIAEVVCPTGAQARCDRGAEATWFGFEMFRVRGEESNL